MTKQELIQQAYGSHYEALKNNINDHGFIRRRVTGHGTTNGMEYEKFGFKREDLEILSFTSDGVYSWRSKTLIGIENNNGWTKIESEADLPENFTGIEFNVIAYPLSGYRQAWFQGGKFHYQSIDSEGDSHWIAYDNVTHYKPVKIEPLPLW